MNIKAAVQRQFEQAADKYAESAVHAAGPELQAMLAAAELRGDERVLDAGCGVGHTALTFAPHVAEVVAVDLTEAMLKQGRRLADERGIDNVSFQHDDIEHLDFPAASFDLVTSRYSAHHYPHPTQALRQIARVLKPSGTLLLCDVVAPDDATTDTFLNAIELLRDPSHVRDHTVGQWQNMLEAAGFEAEALQIWPLRLEFAAWVVRMRTPSMTVVQIRSLIGGAPEEVRNVLAIEADYSFTVPVALLRGRKSAA